MGLLSTSKSIRTAQLARQKFAKDGNVYNAANPDALSDGDDLGRGELAGQVGTRTDIASRTTSLARQQYNPQNVYRVID